MKEVFDPIDTNKNGVIEFSEFWNWYKLRNVKQEKAKVQLCMIWYLSVSPSVCHTLSFCFCLSVCLSLSLSLLDFEMRFENETKIKYLSSLQIVFDAVDSNKDGVISLTEWTYGYLEYLLHSGPDSPMSLWFEPITVNE